MTISNELRYGAVYPGHPVTIAWIIVNTYPSFAEAMRTPEGSTYCNALGSCDVPGAGGNVHAALRLLQKVVVDGAEFVDQVEWANSYWHTCDSQGAGGYSVQRNPDGVRTGSMNPDGSPESERYRERWRKGQEQADLYVQPLRERLATWGAA